MSEPAQANAARLAAALETLDVDVLALSLERLIEVKRKLDRPKDKLMLLQLEATLNERDKSR